MIVSLNLRGPLTAPTPIIEAIRDATGLSTAAIGLLTSIPVLCFGVFAPAAGWIVLRIGIDRATVIAMIAAAVGIVVRAIGTASGMYAGSLIIGLALTVGNVVALMIIRRDFVRSVGPVTGAYTAALNIGTILTSTITAPMAAATGWRLSLGGWALLALAAAALWAFATRGRRDEELTAAAEVEPPAGDWWRRPVVWALAIIMAVHLFVYNAITAWLPSLLSSTLGMTEVQSGFAASLTQLLSIGTAMAATPLLRGGHPRATIALLASCWVIAPLGFGLAPQLWVVWSIVGSVAQGALYTAVFMLTVLVSRSNRETARVSSIVQGLGYGLASLGPILTGWMHDQTSSWLAGMLLTAGVGAIGVVACLWVRVPKEDAGAAS